VCDPRTGGDDLEPVDLNDEAGSREQRRRSTPPASSQIRQSLRSRISALAAAVTAVSVAAAIVVTLALTHHTASHPPALPSAASTNETASTPHPGVEVFAPVDVFGWAFWVQDWTFAAVYQGRPAGEGRKWVIVNATVTNGALESRLFASRIIVELHNCDGPDYYRIDAAAGDADYGTAATHLLKFVFRIPTTVSRLYLRFPPPREEASLDCA